MILSIKSTLLAATLAYIAAANPLPQGGTITRQPPRWRLNPYPEYTSYCTSTSTKMWTQELIPMPPPDVITTTRYRRGKNKLVHKALDCGECAYLDVAQIVTNFDHPHLGYRGPTGFKYVTTTVTFTHLHCSGWRVPPPRFQDAKKRELGGGGDDMMEYVDFENDSGVLFHGGEDCTARVLQVPKLNIGPTRTIFTTTTTTDRIVNCGTCTNNSPIPIPLGVPPVAIFKTTVTAVEPYTETELVCGTSTTSSTLIKEPAKATATTSIPYTITKESITTVAVTKASPENVPAVAVTTSAATTPSQTTAQGIVAHTEIPVGTVLPDCVLTYALQADHQGSTKTVYTSTVTHTKQRACGQCALVWWQEPSEPTVTSFVKTVTKKGPKTETVLVCSEGKA